MSFKIISHTVIRFISPPFAVIRKYPAAAEPQFSTEFYALSDNSQHIKTVFPR